MLVVKKLKKKLCLAKNFKIEVKMKVKTSFSSEIYKIYFFKVFLKFIEVYRVK
jgi:hypothetical protein